VEIHVRALQLFSNSGRQSGNGARPKLLCIDINDISRGIILRLRKSVERLAGMKTIFPSSDNEPLAIVLSKSIRM
jgi:hypothetical protein